MELCYFVALGVLSLVLGSRGDDCSPPKPGDKTPSPYQCCKKERKIPDVMKVNIPKCIDKAPLTGKSDPQEVRNAAICTAECVFEESNLLTPEGKVDLPTFKKIMAETYPEKKNSSANVDKCASTIGSRIDPTSECKSGALELQECLRRDCFLHCPKDLWTTSKECEELRKKVEQCPGYPLVDDMDHHH